MNEAFHYLKFKNLSKNWKKFFLPEKIKLWSHWEFCAYHIIFGLSKTSEYLYRQIDVLSKQTTCEMKALQVQVYIQQWFHDELNLCKT